MSTSTKSQTITLAEIQAKIHVPKKHWNQYGEFWYRKTEDIVEAAKPVLNELGFYLIVTDDIIQVGNYNYFKSVATISNGKESYSASGIAREIIEKKKMDSSQLSGVASAYSRKMALGGLLGVDDTEDADSDKIPLQEEGKKQPSQKGSTTVTTPAKKPDSKEYIPSDNPPISFRKKFSAGTPGQIEMLFDMLVLLTGQDMEEATEEYNRRGRNRSVISDLITKYQQKVDKLKSQDPATISYKKDLIKKLANPLITEEERTEMISGINKMTFSRITKAIATLEQTIAERQYSQKQTA